MRISFTAPSSPFCRSLHVFCMGNSLEVCRFDAISEQGPRPVVNPFKCEGCKVCVAMCPENAIDFPEKHCGRWFESETRFGSLIHAQLFPGEENSGRLVALLKRKAQELALKSGGKIILSDGPPGIGCPVISALSGTDLAVLVTEPTPSGLHDLERVAALCGHFSVPAVVVINKSDLNAVQVSAIEAFCQCKGFSVIAKLPHEPLIIVANHLSKQILLYPYRLYQ